MRMSFFQGPFPDARLHAADLSAHCAGGISCIRIAAELFGAVFFSQQFF
jgi:hypothetical protein